MWKREKDTQIASICTEGKKEKEWRRIERDEGDVKREKYVRKGKSWEENINSVKYKYK